MAFLSPTGRIEFARRVAVLACMSAAIAFADGPAPRLIAAGFAGVAYLWPGVPRPAGTLRMARVQAVILPDLLGFALIGPGFGLVTALCVALSVAYSHPRPRWKGRPGLDLVTNMLGYGAGTTAAGLLTGRAALPDGIPAAGPDAALHCLAFALLFGSFYPLTQIYQLEADRGRGDRTLTTRLGATGALTLALGLGFGALVAMQAALAVAGRGHSRWLPAIALFLWLLHLVNWRRQAGGLNAAAHERGMYRALALWALTDIALVAAWLG